MHYCLAVFCLLWYSVLLCLILLSEAPYGLNLCMNDAAHNKCFFNTSKRKKKSSFHTFSMSMHINLPHAVTCILCISSCILQYWLHIRKPYPRCLQGRQKTCMLMILLRSRSIKVQLNTFGHPICSQKIMSACFFKCIVNSFLLLKVRIKISNAPFYLSLVR